MPKITNSEDRAAVRTALEKVQFTALLGGLVAPSPENHQEGNIDSSMLALFKNGQFTPYTK